MLQMYRFYRTPGTPRRVVPHMAVALAVVPMDPRALSELLPPDPLLGESLHRIMFALEMVAWDRPPAQIAEAPQLRNLGLEAWEIEAYRQLSQRALEPGTAERELQCFFLLSAALRIKMEEERAEITRLEEVGNSDRLYQLLEGSARSLERAISAVIDNAIKFSFDGGTVELWGHVRSNGSIILSVKDSGPGLSQQKLRECLQPFVQENMSYSRPADGLGLGLPIAKAICEAHGGELAIQTSPGTGLLAAIVLPASLAQTATSEAQHG